MTGTRPPAAGFLAELYTAGGDPVVVDEVSRRAAAAAEASTEDGVPVRLVRTIAVPGDEMCFLLFEAASADDVAAVTRRARLVVDRIIPAAVVE